MMLESTYRGEFKDAQGDKYEVHQRFTGFDIAGEPIFNGVFYVRDHEENRWLMFDKLPASFVSAA